VNDTTRVASGQSAGWSGDASRVPGLADALFGYAEVARAMVWSIESTRMALDFNRALLDIGRDVLRRQQDAAIASALQALGGAATPPDQEAVSPTSRISCARASTPGEP